MLDNNVAGLIKKENCKIKITCNKISNHMKGEIEEKKENIYLLKKIKKILNRIVFMNIIEKKKQFIKMGKSVN